SIRLFVSFNNPAIIDIISMGRPLSRCSFHGVHLDDRVSSYFFHSSAPASKILHIQCLNRAGLVFFPVSFNLLPVNGPINIRLLLYPPECLEISYFMHPAEIYGTACKNTPIFNIFSRIALIQLK
ncbi:hypothetical protein, partial [Heyndrickxia coagulans]|uniref:hypothetical protein n=3 Tax=Heyndrickxia coagulans TaxID=1398 RepID=UPI00214D52EC